MSLRKKIILCVLTVLILGGGITAFLFRDVIGAIISGLRYSSEEIEQQLEHNNQAIQDAAQMIPQFIIRELTDAEKQALKDGTITPEELAQNMVAPAPEPESTTPVAPQVPKQEDTTPSPPDGDPEPKPEPESVQVSDYQKRLAAIIAEVYVLREEFLIKLDNLMAEAKAEYRALPKEERTGSKLASLASKYYARAHSLELECDSRIKEIIVRMETLLRENGQDLSIAQAVYDTYLNEKSLKKSWYLAELKKKGF